MDFPTVHHLQVKLASFWARRAFKHIAQLFSFVQTTQATLLLHSAPRTSNCLCHSAHYCLKSQSLVLLEWFAHHDACYLALASDQVKNWEADNCTYNHWTGSILTNCCQKNRFDTISPCMCRWPPPEDNRLQTFRMAKSHSSLSFWPFCVHSLIGLLPSFYDP